MKLEREITVLVTCSYEQLNKELLTNKFRIKEEYELIDDYMIDKKIDINSMNKLEILKNCILIRNIVSIKKMLLYKYKKYASNGDILEQGKIECPIENIDSAINFMEAINYKKLFTIRDKSIVYSNGKTELAVQLVNDKYIFIELEDGALRSYKDIEEMKEDLNSYNLSIDKNNYFVKKAEIMLEEILERITL